MIMKVVSVLSSTYLGMVFLIMDGVYVKVLSNLVNYYFFTTVFVQANTICSTACIDR